MSALLNELSVGEMFALGVAGIARATARTSPVSLSSRTGGEEALEKMGEVRRTYPRAPVLHHKTAAGPLLKSTDAGNPAWNTLPKHTTRHGVGLVRRRAPCHGPLP